MKNMKILKIALAGGVMLLALAYAAVMLGWINIQGSNEPQATGDAKPQVAAQQELKPMSPCAEAKPGGPEEIVRTLYTQYPFTAGKAVDLEPRETLAKYFDEKLTGLLLENQQCAKSSGEVCAIDGNMLYDAQDIQASDFKVCEMDAATHAVKIQFRNFGEPRVMAYDLVGNKDSGWKIADIRAADKDSLADSVGKYFRELAAGWEKAQQVDDSSADAKALPPCDTPKAGGPEELVRALYEQYPWKGDRIVIAEPRDVLVKFFDDKLAGAIVKNQEAQAGKGGEFQEMPNLMINRDMGFSQEIRNFRICAMDAAKAVRVQYSDDHHPVVVTYKMVSTGADWRISDIQHLALENHAESDPPYDWSMLEAFAE